ncbi:DUF294 nucleotidyltransferase-like domain-containing protein [Marinomonas fungiae]|uniref:Signal-transduction protein containing cAMP-binding, CBS, and nucleotidyltransferase domains n=1 Tax=Marinomonas fungiae TaxID=1137284 RepID=A0A0K6IGX0_9GAMM|nr:DUF294 nucleotidyltransferase-like domain-containing protein [Marinomonas fungiae]CUB02567.1 Signal-transduction protein containing cAMP-binding, CBS, and nucleotidyltransferase domains [Marinomonas fungiae]
MEAEQIEIAEFLGRYPPFSFLPEKTLNRVATSVEITYFRQGADVYRFGDEIHDLCVIRSGSIEIYRRNGNLYNRLSVGDVFGQLGLLMKNRIRLPSRALEDSLIYFIPEAVFNELCDNFEEFAYFVEIDDKRKMNKEVQQQREESALSSVKVSSLIVRQPVMISTDASIRQAALKMTHESVSSLLIVNEEAPLEDDGDCRNKLVGILTDRDLRTRVVAQGIDLDQPVSSVMTHSPKTLDKETYVFEAMLTMLRFNLHHLPVVENDEPLGVIAISDIVRYESKNSLFIVGLIHRQHTVEELITVSKDIQSCFVRMVHQESNAHMIGSAMSVIGRSFKQRLLEIAEEKLGPPPVPYCFLALGSMARDEQLLITDQDNALILSNEYDAAKHGEYFEALSEFVSEGLDKCGYPFCTGRIMATNPRWRKTITEWRECFADWIDHPNPDALLHSSVFFDLEGVYGKVEWAEDLYRFIVNRAKNSPKFLASLARNALLRTPPLGFFKEFVMEQDGEHRRTINLKRRGTAPLADLIRVHALAVGSTSRNSIDRLDDVIKAGILPDKRGQELKYAMEYLAMVRIRHQVEDVEESREPDNNIEPDTLSDIERRNLKEAFNVLSNSQRFLKYRYPFS